MSKTIKHAVIVCHPAEESFTLSAAQRYAETVSARGQEVVVRDLYRMDFDPILRDEERSGAPGEDVVAEWALLGDVDVFVLVYPIWFGAHPVLLVDYVDLVFGAGCEGGFVVESNLLDRKRLVSLSFSGLTRARLNEKGVLKSLRTVYGHYLSDVFDFAEPARY